jgi:septum formation protein
MLLDFKDKTLILASASPRRLAFFKDMGLPFESRIKPVDEIFPRHLKAEKITNYLAKLKAAAFKNDLKDHEILVTSDTIVWFKNQALNKPTDEADAIKMLQRLSGKKHEVITSVCIKTTTRELIFHDKTAVFFEMLSTEEINHYVSQFKPLDKAGSYGIQDWIGLIGIKKIKGSYCNVVGLPTNLLYKKLKSIL